MKFISLSEKDIPLILNVQKGNFSDGWNAQMLSSAFNSQNFFAVALETMQVVAGIITYSLAQDSADIEGVVVERTERKKGYGKKLVEYIVQELKDKGVKKIFLEVREGNLPALALYASCGFNKISVRNKYYPDGENAIVMIKEI